MIQSNSQVSQSETVTQSASQVVHDIVSLAELQAQLFKSDAQESVAGLMRPVVMFAIAGLLLLAALPICLVAIALGLIALGLPSPAAFALVALAALCAAAGMALWARRRVKELPAAFSRSQEELVRNIAWIKDAVLNLSYRHGSAAADLRNGGHGRA